MADRGTPRLTAAQAIRILNGHGFVEISQKGSHRKLRNGVTRKQVIVPDHKGNILPLGTMRAIVQGSGIPDDHWLP